MSKEIGMKAVYSYYFPKTREVVNQVDNVLENKRFYLTQTSMEEAAEIVAPLNLKNNLELPARADGTIDMDAIHNPVIGEFANAHKDVIVGLKDFAHGYPSSGSSEAIFKYLAELRAKGTTSIYTLEGEYEGYREYSKILGIDTTEVDLEKTSPEKLKPGIWFISNPSARDGNIIPNKTINDICNAGHNIAMDYSYVGSTKDYRHDATHPNVKVAFFSLSKPYGLFWERIGFAFSREPIESLFANKWFKDVRGLLIATNVMDKIGPSGLHPLYRDTQEKIVSQIAKDENIPLIPSDALLLGYVTEKDSRELDARQKDLLEMFKRGKGYRVCITPSLEKDELRKT